MEAGGARRGSAIPVVALGTAREGREVAVTIQLWFMAMKIIWQWREESTVNLCGSDKPPG